MPAVDSLPEVPSLIALARKKRVSLYLVGGYLRDQFLTGSARPKRAADSRDLDFIVSREAVAFARAYAKQSRGAFILLDAESGCARVARRINGCLWTYDFADLRAGDVAGDIKKRDFTINTFVVDLMVLKPGQDILAACFRNVRGRADIKARTIRMTGPGAFDDDPLRLLRAYSLAAQTGFTIEARTRAAIAARVGLIRKASPERVREELFKVLASSRAARVIGLMEKSGLLFKVIPQLQLMESVPKGGYHHLNVWKHSLLALAEFEKLVKSLGADQELMAYLSAQVGGGHSRAALIKFAILLHDTGKPETRRDMPGGRVSFHGHERVGRDIARIICRQYKLSTAERYAIEDMVALHLRPGYLTNFKSAPEKMVFRFMRDAREEAAAVLLLALADQRATRGPLTTPQDIAHYAAIVLPLINLFFAKKKEKPFVRLIDGHDLIKELQLTPGPEFKEILAAIDEAQHLGKISTREQALELARSARPLNKGKI
ncbi:MAG: HD domain-containing protein [Candidatus Omnitrophica bacterium]|nr:HD domain-containing protein [Candidatus Omnitrophota bacterium]